MPSLADIYSPGMAGFLSARQRVQEEGRANQAAQLQQATTLAALLQHAQAAEKAQREQQRRAQYEAAIGRLPSDATEDQLLQAARPFQGPDQIGQQITASRDRKAKLEAENVHRAAQRDAMIFQIEERGRQKLDEIEQRAREQRITQADAIKERGIVQENIARLVASLKPAKETPAPIVQTDERGNTRLYDRQGNLVKDLGATGKPSAALQAREAKKQQLVTEINTAITELEKATADKGLIDQSTGSGAGALVDVATGFFGKATPGAIAVGRMKPIYDLVLKMVPRFEGPQSDKDTKLYMEASGQLANPAVPNDQKKAAGKEILRLMKARKSQFVSKDMVGTEADAPSSGGVKFLGFE